jgi:hypothetical protein
LAIGWLTEEQSATNQYQQQFRLDIINLAFNLIFNFSFSIGFGSRLDVIKFQPIAKPYRCTSPY